MLAVNYAVYLFSTRKKSCFLSEHVPFVLKLADVIVTSPSWLPNHFPRHSTGNKQYPSAGTATKHRKASKPDLEEGLYYVTLHDIFSANGNSENSRRVSVSWFCNFILHEQNFKSRCVCSNYCRHKDFRHYNTVVLSVNEIITR